MKIEFLRPWMLLLLLLLPGFVAATRTVRILGRGRKNLVLVLRCVGFVLLVGAVAESQLLFESDYLSVMFVVDRSSSIPASDRRLAEVYIAEQTEKMTDKEAERLAAQWKVGQSGKRGVPVLEGGMTFKPVTMNNNDAQFIEGRNFTVQDIGRLFGIPAPLLNASMPGSSLQYRNQEGIATEYASNAVQPVTEVIEAGFGMLIPTTQEVRFNFSQLLRADAPTRYRVYDLALKDSILSINEVRRLELLAPIPGGGDIPETGWIDESGAEPLISQPTDVQAVEVIN